MYNLDRVLYPADTKQKKGTFPVQIFLCVQTSLSAGSTEKIRRHSVSLSSHYVSCVFQLVAGSCCIGLQLVIIQKI